MRATTLVLLALISMMVVNPMAESKTNSFSGRFITGTGDREYLAALDTSLRMFHEDPELPNISMVYTPEWNGLYEGASWDAWWIQNSYGASLAAMPFIQEPYLTFLQNANDLWFQWIGDGKKLGQNGVIGPDGCLCDAVRPNFVHYKQGDGMVAKHDYAVEFTGAGIIIQGELLLVRRDMDAIRHYLPMLERSEAFLNARRDPVNDLFLVGLSGNLLGPSWTGTQYPDGTLDMGYLSGMSVTYIAALDRLIELEKMVGNGEKIRLYEIRRQRAKKALVKLMTDEGYFIKGIDKLGAKHGVYGAAKYGYFESSVNHDAVALGVVDDEQSKRIMDKMTSIPGLRPHGLIISNYPALDDMIDMDFGFGQWVNGGHWSTCEARMILAYYRVGRHADALESMRRIMRFFNDYRIDNPLTECGNEVWFKDRVTTIIYDGFGIPAALIRGLFQPAYFADRMTLTPSIPDGIDSLDQSIPLRFGRKQIHLSVSRRNGTSSVTLNGDPWTWFDGKTIALPYDEIPEQCHVVITLPTVAHSASSATVGKTVAAGTLRPSTATEHVADQFASAELSLRAALKAVESEKASPEFETAFIRSTLNAITAYRIRVANDTVGRYSTLPEAKRKAIIDLYEKAAKDLLTGLTAHLRKVGDSGDSVRSRLWKAFEGGGQ